MLILIRLIAPLTCILFFNGCFPAVIAGGVIVGTSVAEDRSISDKLDDNIIKIKIQERMGQEDFSEIFGRVTVTTHEARVLLTGSIKDKSNANRAVKIAWSVRGIKEVINELEINSRSIGSVTKDSIAANTIRSKILFNGDIKSVNYKIEVNNSVVYILGVARDSAELNKVVDIARHVKGINKVVNHAILIVDNRRSN